MRRPASALIRADWLTPLPRTAGIVTANSNRQQPGYITNISPLIFSYWKVTKRETEISPGDFPRAFPSQLAEVCVILYAVLGLLQIDFRPTRQLRRTITVSTEQNAAAPSWSRDTSAEAATLQVTCRKQSQMQVLYIDASNRHWTCTTVLGLLRAVYRWIQSSTRSEVRRHRWSSSCTYSNWIWWTLLQSVADSHAGPAAYRIPYLTVLSLPLSFKNSSVPPRVFLHFVIAPGQFVSHAL